MGNERFERWQSTYSENDPRVKDEEIRTLREENARLRQKTNEIADRLGVALREARAEVKRKDDLILDCAVSDGIPLSVDAEARRIRAARSGSEEVKRCAWCCGPADTSGRCLDKCRWSLGMSSGSEERGQPMLHAFDCPCVMCDPMQVREEQQRRSRVDPGPTKPRGGKGRLAG